MYSFEGDYRRKPQQNLAGASKRNEKSALLQHAQLERSKREQQCKRHSAALKILAHTRSYLVRRYARGTARQEFDDAKQVVGKKNLSVEELVPYVKRLLFFYNWATDAPRLIWLLQHFLKHHEEIKLRCVNSPEWFWRLRWILRICMEHNSRSYADGAYSMAIPLRVLETFTIREDAERILHGHASSYLENIFLYLINHEYFEQLRELIDDKVPSMLEASPIAPTLISKCLLDMIKRPLDLIAHSEEKDHFSTIVLREFCRSILSPRLSDPVRMFIIPSLSEFKEFPYMQLIDCINRLSIEPTISLLYSVLSLESSRFLLPKSKDVPVSYLKVLASASSTIVPLVGDHDIEQSDSSDTESNANMIDQEQADILQQCLEMLNEEQRVQGILQAVDRYKMGSTVLQPVCQLCHHLLISDKLAIHKYKLLYMLAFKPIFLKHLWNELLSVRQTSLFNGTTPLLQIISRGIALSKEDTRRIVPLLAVFCSLFSLLVSTLHDTEFLGESENSAAAQQQQTDVNAQQAMPFRTEELVMLSSLLKSACLGMVELAFPDSRPSIRDDYKTAVLGPSSLIHTQQDTQIWTHLFKMIILVLRQLHTRDLRRQFCPDGHWLASNITIPVDKPQDFTLQRRRRLGYVPFLPGLPAFTRDELEEGPPLSVKEVRILTLLRQIPFVVPFNDRVVVFQSMLYRDKVQQQDQFTHIMQGPIVISVRRNYLYEDAFEKLSPENEPDLRLKIRVQLVNTAGLEEAGVDGGGLFREFLSELLRTSFDPNRGFFKLTKDNMLYPNPTVQLLVDDFPKHYYFIGRIVGKALYENLLVELPFAEFFLSKMVRRSSDVDVHHLAFLDPVMYRNLLYLKNYKGDVTDLGLDFTVLSDELGERRVEELKANGANIAVTNNNRIEYIHLMADYKLNKQIRAQCYAFKQGIGSVIPLDWLQIFNYKELQVLISGAQIPVDVSDLKSHTNYAGGYAADHPTITAFWKVVHEFSDQQKSQLLKFVTSCSRPPLLGFKELDPPFCIQHAGSVDRLPTSSTCMNLLKLPEFPDEKTLREKLLYAIQAGAGFELS